MSEKIVKVTLVEEPEKRQEDKSINFAHLEQLTSRLMEVEKLLEEFKAKLSDAESELKEFKNKSPLEKRFSELTGNTFKDLTPELEQKVKTLQAEVENLTSERARLRNEILTGLSNVIMPVETDGLVETTEEETFFKFRDGARYPNITAFLKKEMKFGNPPIYVTINPEGIRVVGLTERTAAVKELVNAIESLRAKAADQIPKPQQTPIPQPTIESPPSEAEMEENIASIFKKAKKRLAVPT